MNRVCHLLAPIKREKRIRGCCCLLATFPKAAQDLGYRIKPKRRPGLAGQGCPHSVLLQLVLVSGGILATGGGSAGRPRDVGTCTGVPRPVSGRAGTVPSTFRQLWASFCSDVSIEQGQRRYELISRQVPSWREVIQEFCHSLPSSYRYFPRLI